MVTVSRIEIDRTNTHQNEEPKKGKTMSENAEDKTKREYLAVHRSSQWTHKHSVFYAQPDDSIKLLKEMGAFKQLLRRRHSDRPFLIRIQTLYKYNKPLQAYLVIYATGEIDDLQAIVDKTFQGEMRAIGQPLDLSKLEESAISIEKQKPHNLKAFFNVGRVVRWTVLNAPLLKTSLRYKTPLLLDDF